MGTPLKIQLPAPADQNIFQDLCEEIAKEYWNDPTAYQIGNQGHSQFGVDILSPLARETGETLVIGVQCKKKKSHTKRKLTKSDIDKTIPLAEKHEPQLSRLIMATTSSKDPKIQAHVAEINIARNKSNKFPILIWFWEDIEKILQEKCPNTYLDYLKTLLPESGKATLSKDLLKEVLCVAEELIMDNYTEKAEGVLSVFGNKIAQLNDPEIDLLTERIKARLFFTKEKVEEGIELLLKITDKFPLDIVSWSLLFDKYFDEDNIDQAEQILKTLKALNAEHPLTKIADLLYKLKTNQEIVYLDEELTGTDREKARACIIFHIYANQRGEKEKRDYYLEKQRKLTPNAASPVHFDIVYKVSDLFEELENTTLEKVQEVWDFILRKEKELQQKNPILLSLDLNIIFEKLKLDVLVIHSFKPRHEITASLKEEATSKICKSYFDYHTYQKLFLLLGMLPLDKNELSRLANYLQITRKEIQPDLGYLILAQALLNDPEFEFAKSICSDLSLNLQIEFINALKLKDKTLLLNHLKNVQENILHPLIAGAGISDYELALDIINGLDRDYDEQTKKGLTHLKIFYLTQRKEENLLDEIKKEIQFENQSFHLLNEVAGYAMSRELWDLEAECLRHMLNFDLSDKDRVQIETRLVISLFNLEDYNGALERKDTLIKNLEKLEAHNQKVAIKVLVLSSINIHDYPLALKILSDNFSVISDIFEFYLYKAEVEQQLGEYETSLSTILDGLRKEKIVSKGIYQACYKIINEISNAGIIKNQNENVVKDDVYVKISGIESWYYIGDKKEIDAIKITNDDDRYFALWEKHIGTEIEWPRDQYKNNPPKRKIESILTEPTFIKARAQETLYKAVEEGASRIWGFDADPEDMEQTIRNMKKLWTDIDKPLNEFFKSYVSKSLPFAFLVKKEGGIRQALSKISTKQEGFIFINDGTKESEKKQMEAAHNALEGAPIFIDATSLLFLIDGELQKVVTDNLHQLYYTPSVPAYLREYASYFAQSPFQMGRISFGNNKEIISFDYDYQKELEIKNRILEEVKYFEENAIKETSDFLSSKKLDIESLLPSCITDPLAAARARNVNIISEDYLYPKALEVLREGNQPLPVSSKSVIIALYDKGKISWEQYLDYVSGLISYRCKNIDISPQILMDAILVKNKSGILVVQPKNIRKLRLDISLSIKYGINPNLALNIISEFFVQIIKEPSVTIETFREIIAEFLIQALKGKDKSFGDKVISICNNSINSYGMIVPVTNWKQKFDILASQIKTYFSEFNPLYENIPILLARSSR